MTCITKKIDEFVKLGSGWSVDKIISLELHIVPYQPVSKASCYVATPGYIAAKKAVLNIVNDDDLCFVWCILASLHNVEDNAHRVSKYIKYFNELDLTGLNFPMRVQDIKKFEKLNVKISVNVFAFDNKDSCIYPVYITSDREREHHVNLLLVTNETRRRNHYVLIKDMSKLLAGRTNHQKMCHYCNYCLWGFSREDLLNSHIEDCRKFGLQKITMPQEYEKWVKFTNIANQLPVPVVIYADFECFTSKIQGPSNPNASTEPYELHEPSGYGFYIVWADNVRPLTLEVYHGTDVVDRFLRRLREEYQKIEEVLLNIVPRTATKQQEEEFAKATVCYLCERPLNGDRVIDHCHLTGLSRGVSHNHCNLQLKYKGRPSKSDDKFEGYVVPVIFHNLRGYDSHLILKQYKRSLFPDKEIACIPNNMEKYVSFSIGNLRFIDSYQFMGESLEKLVSNLPKDDFKHMIMNCSVDKLHLLLRKGVFPYEYWDSPTRFDERLLPPPEAFYSRLTDEEISDEDYEHAQKVWKTFNIETLADYHDLYLKCDVLLLADVFENFRSTCVKYYKLDPAHYYTAPGLAWDAMLKMTNTRLELMVERELHDVIDKGVRGGICCISRKCATANNKYIPEDYNSHEPSKFIVFLDANGLYATAMSEPLPTGNLRFLDEQSSSTFNFMSVPDDSPIGYILEVDLEYADSLHDLHNDYPLCPENTDILPEDLSPYTKKNLAQKLGISIKKSRKLVCNLKSKSKYVIHYRNLKLYVQLGLVVTKIHRVISFEQSCWMKPYVDFNMQMRKHAKSEFEKNFFKLMVNSVFGKTMENIRKRQDVRLVTNVPIFKRLTAKPNFKSFKIFSEDLTAVHMTKPQVLLNKATYVGMSILDISKIFMYKFHYQHIKQLYGNKATLLMTDTDSLLYVIETEDFTVT